MIPGAEAELFSPWQTTSAAMLPEMLPYDPGMKVTPLSTYGEHVWSFPEAWVPVNAPGRADLDFLAPAVLDDTEITLVPGQDDRLIQQLKELLIVYMFRRGALREGRSRLGSGRPTGFHSYLQRARRIFCCMKIRRISSLSEIDLIRMAEIMDLASSNQATFRDTKLIFEDLLALSRKGLITDPLGEMQPFFTAPNTPTDATAPLGIQPIPDAIVAALIQLSLDYLRRSPAIVERLAMLVADPKRQRAAVLGWAQVNLPCGRSIPDTLSSQALINALTWMLQVPAAHLFCFYVGPRASELLSASPWCVTPGKVNSTLLIDQMQLEFETVKGIGYAGGAVRKVPAHPILNDAADAADLARSAVAPYSEYLFVHPESGEPYCTTQWNYALQRFCNLHSIDYKISSHQWRKTVASICTRVLLGAAVHLKEVLGHKGLATLVRYMLASPFVRAELRDGMLDEYRRRGHTLLESLSVMGGDGVGGRGGRDLEMRIRTLMGSSDVTEIDMKVTIDEWVEDMLAAGIYPMPVMPGVMCIKPRLATGACASSSTNRAADVARCTPRCPFQVQQAYRRDLVLSAVRNLVDRWDKWSEPQRRFWARSLKELLESWPDLPSDIRQRLDSTPMIGRMMDEAI